MQIVPLAIVTALLFLGILGTVAKLLFDDWQARRAIRSSVRVPFLPKEDA